VGSTTLDLRQDHHQKAGALYTTGGVFVCFEGGEGAGKSTQARALAASLDGRGFHTLLTFEPGDTPVGKEVRRIVLDPATGELSDRTEVLLYAADKAELRSCAARS
jgi:dTMP kinase